MDDYFDRNLQPLLLALAAKEDGEETEDGEELDYRDPTPPPRPFAKDKSALKIHFPKRIWNEVVAEGELDRAKEVAAKPKKNSKRLRSESILTVVDAEVSEQEAQDSRPRRRRRVETEQEAGEDSRRVEATSSSGLGAASKRSSRIPPAAGPSSRQPPAENPYKRQYSNCARSATLVTRSVPVPALATRTKGKGKAKAEPALERAPASESAPASVPWPKSQWPNYVGPRTMWLRLFPHLNCEFSEYKGVPDAWRELMLWDKDQGCWRARRLDGSEPYVKQVLGGIGFLTAWSERRWGPEREMQREWNWNRRLAEEEAGFKDCLRTRG
ncbi:hypothetical protein AG0111_0g12705 [Alternaria gaisen]|uniref:Uncharacterized protein n=1 Tax=Alternaria gaisen TaxID=167740 RepID=A0ACB6F3V8_9PLEO|nr:hypothetical protein AG0111_0g12705 [Alternaria gaisen]